MKRLGIALALLAAVSLMAPPAAQADTILLLNAATSSQDSPWYSLDGYTKASVQISSVGGAGVGTVSFQWRNTPSDSPVEIVAVSNPTSGGRGFVGPGKGYVRVSASAPYGSISSGTFNATLVRTK